MQNHLVIPLKLSLMLLFEDAPMLEILRLIPIYILMSRFIDLHKIILLLSRLGLHLQFCSAVKVVESITCFIKFNSFITILIFGC